MTRTDYRDPALRREAFLDSWEFHNRYGTHPGCVQHLLPAIAERYELDADERAWLVWLNGNTQNPATSLLLLDASDGRPANWEDAVHFWDVNFKKLEWDIDRRYHKSKFGEATQKLVQLYGTALADEWAHRGLLGWDAVWRWANNLPYMGRLSAWSMTEYARILLGADTIPDADSLLLGDPGGSRSHRSGLAVVAGYDAAYWTWEETKDLVPQLEQLGEELLAEMMARCPETANRLNLESALCCYKSWHKPRRRYPNVYADMAYYRIRKAESRFGDRFGILWTARRDNLPEWARLEDMPNDPGMVPEKQEHYLHTGQPIMMGRLWPKYWSDFEDMVEEGAFGVRHDFV